MFGTVRPHACALTPDDRAAYRQLYCGTCRGLGEYSLPVRALVSYDVVLFSAVIGGVQAKEACTDSCRCPLNPLVHKPIVSPRDPAMRAGPAVQLLLASAWLEDHAQDGPGGLVQSAAGWLRPLLPVQRALAELAELGFETAPLLAITARQRLVERPGVSPEIAAEPTAALVGSVLASALDLPGVDPALQTASARKALERMGKALGEVIYLIDALEDLGKDAASGAFNPCLSERGHPEQARVELAVQRLQSALAALTDGVSSFPWRRHGGLLEHSIAEQLPRRVASAVQRAQAALEASLQPPVPREPWSRWLAGRLIAFAGDEAFDLPESHRKKRKKQNDEGGDDGSSWCPLECCQCCECGDCGCGSCGECGGCGECGCGVCDCCGGCDCSCG